MTLRRGQGSEAVRGAVEGSVEDARTQQVGRWFAWLTVLLAGWIVGGLFLVVRALNRGDASDAGLSPYHAVPYAGLAALTAVTLWLTIRAVRDGRSWSRAFPAGYGSLGAGLLLALAYVVVDVAWREGVGIGPGIERGLAPSRVLVLAALVLISMAPLRAALLAGPGQAVRWPAVLSAGLVVAVLGSLGGFHPTDSPWLERVPDAALPDGEIWLMDPDGGRQTRLVVPEDASADGLNVDLGNPVWSPDGAQLAYTSFRGGSDPSSGDQDIWVAGADGRGARPFLTGDAWQWFPRWSPDGQWIGYTEEARGGPWISGGPAPPPIAPGPQGPDIAPPAAIIRPEADLWLVRADGSAERRRVTDTPGDDRSGSWSPDGARLAFDSTRDGNTEIYLIDADGTNPVRVTDDPAEDWSASWSPDGSRIAFASGRTGIAQVFVMNVDGSDVTQLTDDPAGSSWPCWSPDGSRIAFVSWRGQEQQIWTMAPDGSDQRQISRSPGSLDVVWDGSWGPDGRIAFARTIPATARTQPVVREDLGVAAMLISVLALAIVVALLFATRPPFGAVAITMGLSTAMVAALGDQWRFVPAAILAGLIVDVAARLVPPGGKAAFAAAGASVGLVLAAAGTVLATTGLGWSPTLLLGVTLAAGAAGWTMGALVAGGRRASGEP